VTYAITSLSRQQADATMLLKYARGRWAIENSCFYILDNAQAEDASRVRTGNAAVALSSIRQSILNFCRQLGKKAREVFTEHGGNVDLLLSRLGIMN
jgi:predicted transposase YbfD/YdcC